MPGSSMRAAVGNSSLMARPSGCLGQSYPILLGPIPNKRLVVLDGGNTPGQSGLPDGRTRRGGNNMKLMWFHLMPYTELPEDFRDKNPSVWVDIHSSLF